MSVKKILMMSAASLAAFGAAAYAGGPADYAAPQASATGLYLEGNVGYAWRDWQDMYYYKTQTPNLDGVDNNTGGFAFIVDGGYQFNDYFSAEVGYIWMTAPGNDNDVSSWSLYFGGKLQAPVYDDQTFIFGKLAAAYNYNGASAANTTYWSPLFAAGVQRYFTPNFSANIQYTFIPAYTDADGTSGSVDNVPQSNILTVGVGYKFLM